MLEEILTKLSGEEIRLDAGLYLCKKLEDDLGDCLNIVERLNRKYNKDPNGDQPENNSSSGLSDLKGDCLLQQKEQEQDKDLDQDKDLGQNKEPGKHVEQDLDTDLDQQLSSSYGDLHLKCLSLKRELDDTMSLTKQINELAQRQRNNYYDFSE